MATMTTTAQAEGNPRARLAALCGALSALSVPAAVVFAERSTKVDLVDAAWSVPVAVFFALAAFLLARGARGTLARTLERSGGARAIRIARFLAVAGTSFALAAAIAVGFYELLLRLEG
ncbi:MAG TPA: hypothetical protein VHD91_04765 [Gaiellaceae bacterium]|nr:hypothetical protein [Gaiellaceae bacterium]